MGLVTNDDGWRLSEKLWKQIEPLLPARKTHPLGCHNPRVPDRDAMNAILFVLRGLPVERARRHRHLFVQFGIPTVPGMDRCRGIRRLLAYRTGQVRRTQGHRLVLAVDGWGHDEGRCGQFKKTGPNPDGPGKARRQAQPADGSGGDSDCAGH